MFRLFAVFFVAAVVLASSVTSADAKRRGGGFVGGYGGSQSVERVVDLPDIPALKRSDGKYVDLGYLHHRLSGGTWVGYIGSSRTYLPLDEKQLKLLMAVGGLEKLPPVPSRPAGSWFWGILMVIGIFLIAQKFLGGAGRLVSGGSAARRSRNQAKAENEPSSAEWGNADDAMARAIAARQPATGNGDRSASFGVAPTATARNATAPDEGRSSFGLRKR